MKYMQKPQLQPERAAGLTRIFHRPAAAIPPALINTPLQRGVGDGGGVETVSTVSTGCRKPLKRFSQHPAPFTPLKRGVNERGYEIRELVGQSSWLQLVSGRRDARRTSAGETPAPLALIFHPAHETPTA